MSNIVPVDTRRPLLDQQQATTIDDNGMVSGAIGANIVLSGQQLTESGVNGAGWFLGAGAQRSYTLSNARSRITAGAGASTNSTCVYKDSATVIGQDFTASSSTPCVSLKNNAAVVFIGCTFRNAGVLGTTTVLIQCASGTNAVFIGCTFTGNSSLSAVVDNPGATGNIRWVGCFNLTGAPDGNVTVVG